ncbi:MAG TPA: MFS transporter [Kofleriaceae bacterium]|nr:MFS transporter [Kofleriaceae bacterium]
MSDDRQPLPREVVVLGWVSFFADISSEMVYALLPLFVVGALKGSTVALGWIEGVAAAVVAVLTALAGWRSDRIRRRVPYVRAGYGLPVIGKSVLAAATAWPLVLVGRTIDRFGKGLRSSPRDALLAEHAGPTQRGRAFGLHRAMDSAGAVLGSLLAAALTWWFARDASRSPIDGLRLVLAIAAGLGLCSFALTWLVHEPPAHADDVRKPDSPSAAATAAAPATSEASPPPGQLGGLGAGYAVTLALFGIFALANSSDTFLLLRSRDRGLEPYQVILAYALFQVVYTIASYPAGALSDRVGRWRMIGAGWAIYALVYAGFAVTGRAGLWPLWAAYGLYNALTDGVGKALIADLAPRRRRGTALGVFYLINGLAALVASLVAGELWAHVGAGSPFWFGAAGAVVALAGLPFVHRFDLRAAPAREAAAAATRATADEAGATPRP